MVRARKCKGTGEAQVITDDVGRAQGSKGAVVEAQVNMGTVGEAHDTRDTTMSLRGGAVGEAHIAPWNAIAKEIAEDG